MSNAFFPISLPGLILHRRTTYHVDTVQEGDTGTEYRLNRTSAPRYRYEFEAKVRDRLSERSELHGFFEAHGGRRDSFLLVDPVDGITRRVRFSEPDLEVERIRAGFYSCAFELVSVVG